MRALDGVDGGVDRVPLHSNFIYRWLNSIYNLENGRIFYRPRGRAYMRATKTVAKTSILSHRSYKPYVTGALKGYERQPCGRGVDGLGVEAILPRQSVDTCRRDAVLMQMLLETTYPRPAGILGSSLALPRLSLPLDERMCSLVLGYKIAVIGAGQRQ
ncbi:uncharacterized protein UV8b_00029 [Ustilaginoidea virens]|uniref:Uncharacterized protein n=1 Tax=Ustilaginoidea virens TaxID=1159556 RepID=A0A8E5HI73_USTVR|nr:uncharacterized protein UV8b_00029 [Ustilaginoidea virens]QUC15788.1 hypothetical protein UV8b_00029 [Ustilaginoidea virens]